MLALHHKTTDMETRTAILQKNFQAICRQGFHATRTDKVIGELGITKGAFYHYFGDKVSMGYAIVDEIIFPMYVNQWIEAQKSPSHSIDAIIETLTRIGNTVTEDTVGLGCPLNNLVQEMSSIDETFRIKLAHVINTTINLIANILQTGINKQEVKPILTQATASFIWASLEGCFGLGKVQKSLATFQSSLQTLVLFLQSLKT